MYPDLNSNKNLLEDPPSHL